MSKLLQQQYDEVLRENVDLTAQSERLLAKIAEAEKAFKEITEITHPTWEDAREMIQIATNALQQLRS